MTGDRLSHLIGQIYDAAEQPGRWNAFLESFAEEMGACQTIICIIDWRRTTSYVGTHVRCSDDVVADYHRHWSGERNPYLQSAHPLMRTDGSVVRGKQLVPQDRMVRTPYHNDFLQKHGIGELAGLNIHTHRPWMAAITAHYAARAGDPDADRLDLCRWLMPHLRNAVSLHLRLGRSEAERDLLETAFDDLPLGVIVVDRRGRTLRTNTEAERILTESDGLDVRFGALSAADPGAQDRLLGLIADAADTGDRGGESSGGSVVVRRFSGRASYRLNVSPLSLNGPLHMRHGGGAVVFVSDLTRRPSTPADRLKEAFGLTPAEARVAILLAEDLTRRQIGERLGKTENTVRTQVRSIYSKAGVRSRAAFVRRASLLSVQAF